MFDKGTTTWTNIVRAFCKISLVLGIIITVVIAIFLSEETGSALFALLVLLLGGSISISSVSVLMMIS